ncbi:MFS transporter [Streptomyces sp. NPDC044984]|uniref:MFS transporter n=1 Tax=Streptomyces sp. NPDC044984 TaxID=3154335 RepID=UPI0033F091D1
MPSVHGLLSTRASLAGYRWFLTGWGATAFGSGLVLPLIVAYLREMLGVSTSGVSLYFALFALSGLVVNPFAAWIGRVRGPGPTAVAATVFQAAGATWLTTADSMAATVPAACLSGAGTGIYYAVQTPLLTKAFGDAAFSRVLSGQHRASALMMTAGSLLGGQAVQWLGDDGYTLCLAANAASYLAYGVVLVRLGRTRAEPRGAASGAAEAGAAAPGRRFAALRDPVFLRLLALQSALVIFGLGQFESVVPAVMRDAHFSVVAISVVIACNTAGIIVFQGLALRLVERVGYTGALWVAILTWLVALAFQAGALLLPAPRGRLLLGVLFGLVFAVGQCLIAPSVQPLVTRTAPPGAVESYAAATSLAHGLGMFVAPLVLFPVVESGGTGSYLSVQLLGYGLALYVLWSFHTRRVTPREEVAQPADKTYMSR